MPTNSKRKATSPPFSPEQIAAALDAAPEAKSPDNIDWQRAIATEGGEVKATLASLRRKRGPNKRPRKVQRRHDRGGHDLGIAHVPLLILAVV